MKTPSDPVLTLKVEKLIYGGWGLARCYESEGLSAQVILIPDVLPGEEVKARLTARRKGYAKAELIEVLTPSPHRCHPPCPVFGTCGGCHLQHMNHTAQLADKQTMLQETLQRMGQISASPLPMIAAPEPYHYRHRVQFKLLQQGHSLKMGFYQRETHELVTIEGCPILHSEIERALKILQESIQDGLPFMRHPTEMHLQYSAHTGQFLIVFYAEGVMPAGLTEFYTNLKAHLPLAGMVAYSQNQRREVRGQPFLLYHLKGMTFRISDQSFAQPNWSMNQIITDQILAYAQLKGDETVLELYSGMGNFSLFLAQQARRVISLESSPQAMKDAEYNVRLNQVSHLELHHCHVQKGLTQLLKNPPTLSLVLLDPPRQGAGQSILKQICSLQPTRILYLSCDPTTLTRDLKSLLLQGYHLRRIQPFDLLPQTYHLEVLAELQKAH